MTEAELQLEVEAMCDHLGLWHYHTANSIGSDKGWPDLVITGRGILFRELKSSGGIVSGDQALVGWKLKAARQDWAVWRPRDLFNGTIERQLREIMEKM
jgi:hypothetical protein